MERQVWLRANGRLAVGVAVLPMLLLIVAVVTMTRTANAGLWWSGAILALLSAVTTVIWLRRACRPRLVRQGDQLAVYLTAGPPILVPLSVVECFFRGQGPSLLPWPWGGSCRAGVETATLIVRLAESAEQWHHRDVQARLGQWCEGYITIRGTACETLNAALFARLNQQLVAAHRALRQVNDTVPA